MSKYDIVNGKWTLRATPLDYLHCIFNEYEWLMLLKERNRCTVYGMPFPISGQELVRGTNCTPHGIKFRISLTQPFDILPHINAVCKHTYNVRNTEIPLFLHLIPDRPDLLRFVILKYLHFIVFYL